MTIRPQLEAGGPGNGFIVARDEVLGARFLCCEGADELLFTNNETNLSRLAGKPNHSAYVKDGINDYVVHGRREAVNPARKGTKSAAHYLLTAAPGQSATIRLRLSARDPAAGLDAFDGFDDLFEQRKSEADEFYGRLIPASLGEDTVRVIRQSYGGLLWSKQAYIYDVEGWLRARGVEPDSANEAQRNMHWFHMYNADVISMPDKWEYPWFAAWDLAFHAAPLAMVDPEFAAGQLDLMLRERYQHPNGQIPAYEWNFGDVNPPVHAWATMLNYRLNRATLGDDAIPFLKRVFRQLLVNFTWWVNRKDRLGKSVFEGGFLGLDNIGVFDRSAELPTGGHLEQADGTAWMAFYAQHMLDMALELALADPSYEDIAIKFYEHVIRISAATNRVGGTDTMWDEEDGFVYDVLRVPGEWSSRLKVRSIVGLLPLCAVTIYRPEVRLRLPNFVARVEWFNAHRPQLFSHLPPARTGVGGRVMLSLLTEDKLRRVLARMLDPAEFLGDFGVRSLSRHHLEHPYTFDLSGTGVPGLVPARRVGHGDVRRQLELARPDLGADQHPARPRAAGDVQLLRRRVPRRVPDRLGAVPDALRRGAGAHAAARRDLPARQGRSPSRVRRHAEVPGRPALARQRALLRVLPRRQRRRARREPPDGVDGDDPDAAPDRGLTHAAGRLRRRHAARGPPGPRSAARGAAPRRVSSGHRGPQLHEERVEGVEAHEPEARELDVEDDVGRERHRACEGEDVQGAHALGRRHADAREERAGHGEAGEHDEHRDRDVHAQRRLARGRHVEHLVERRHHQHRGAQIGRLRGRREGLRPDLLSEAPPRVRARRARRRARRTSCSTRAARRRSPGTSA